MKKIMSLLLVAVLALSMAACGTTEPTTAPTQEPTSAPTTAPTEAPTTAPTEEPTAAPTEEPTEEPTEAKKLSMLMMSAGEGMNMDTVSIYDDDMGGLYVSYSVNGVRKVATLDLSLLAGLEEAMMNSGMMDLAGTEEYGEGTNSVSFYASYTDWSSVSVSYYGVEAPEAFTTAYNTLIAYIETMIADVPLYVPQAAVMGEVDESILPEMQAIVNNAGIMNIDMMAIQPIEMDEYFGMVAGLSSSEGITAAANCQSMMMGGAVYSLVIVKTENTATVAADFEANLDWNKWVCVRPSNAIIATKGDMVLCLMADASMYNGTVSAMQTAGWTTVNELTDPGM